MDIKMITQPVVFSGMPSGYYIGAKTGVDFRQMIIGNELFKKQWKKVHTMSACWNQPCNQPAAGWIKFRIPSAFSKITLSSHRWVKAIFWCTIAWTKFTSIFNTEMFYLPFSFLRFLSVGLMKTQLWYQNIMIPLIFPRNFFLCQYKENLILPCLKFIESY